MARKPRKPKAPKTTASVQVWENYYKRLQDWKKRCNKIEADKKRKANLIQKARSFR